MDILMDQYLDYNVEEDSNGSKGMAIADALLKRYNYDLVRLNLEVRLQRLKKKLQD